MSVTAATVPAARGSARVWTAIDLTGWGLILLLLWLQHLRIPGFLTSYGTDLFTPAFLYLQMRANRTLLRRLRPNPPSPVVSAVLIFSAGVVWEFSQYTGFTRGTFDPLDLLAYAGALLACLGGERLWRRRVMKRGAANPLPAVE